MEIGDYLVEFTRIKGYRRKGKSQNTLEYANVNTYFVLCNI
jgi:hypothetical protein